MPATEQSFRNIKLLHKVFAVSGALLLLMTIWMLWADHADPWKPYQRQRTSIDLKMNQWDQLQFQTNEAADQHAALAEEIALARLEVPNLEAFKAEAKTQGHVNFSAIDVALKDLEAAVNSITAVQLSPTEPGVQKKRDNARQEVKKKEAAAGEAEAKAAEAKSKIATATDRAAAQAQAKEEAERAAEAQKAAAAARETLRQVEAELAQEFQVVAGKRTALFELLQGEVRSVRAREDKLLGLRKFRNADLDAARAALNILIRDNRPAADQARAQQEIARIVADIEGTPNGKEGFTQQYQAVNAHRIRLQTLVADLNAKVEKATKAQADSLAKLKQLQKSYASLEPTWFTTSYPLLGKKWLNLPIIDAFGAPEKPKQIWLQDLTYDFNFKRVARFDRCITCHQSLDKAGSAPGEPLYAKERRVELTLQAPAADSLPEASAGGKNLAALSLEEVYGIRLSESGLISPHEAAVSLVLPLSPAARAELAQNGESQSSERSGLQVGDVIEVIEGNRIDSPSVATRLLLREEAWGKPVRLSVRRGLPNPFTSHPRLDLYLSDSSPHPMNKFGCTICHEGQDSGTSFQWTSHSPNDLVQRGEWAEKYRWFDNHHWIYPMYPERFSQSGCLKCHHQVVELRASEKFPEPPAPKLVHGYDLIRKYGCFGCHEITGQEGGKQLGPDLRLEPNFFAAAQQIQADSGFSRLTAEEKRDVETVVARPDRDDARHRVLALLAADSSAKESRLSAAAHRMAPVLKNMDAPGDIRKVGPSLRYVQEKIDPAFLVDWIRDPKHFRPSTRMPQFFGLTAHLQESPAKKDEVTRYEAVEVLGIAEYLRTSSQPFEPVSPPQGIAESTPEEKAARGRVLFETRGCLACHNHEQFPNAAKMRPPGEIVQGPDLSDVPAKFTAERNSKGRTWLYGWIREPWRYHARTVMPDLFLLPIKQADGKLTDPADDIVEFLLSGEAHWQPAAESKTALDASSRADLRALSLEHLKKSFHESRAKRYLSQGIPEAEASDVRGAELQLVGQLDESTADHKQLMYIGQKALAKYGCFACHDVPGFEDAKPIGTNLNNWGRKDPTRLAFEHIGHYAFGHGHGHGDGHAAETGTGHTPAAGNEAAAAEPAGKAGEAAGHEPAAASHAAAPAQAVENVREGDLGFYRQALESGNRTGFIYQKLKEPRSYDYRVAENRAFNDLLRMPQFPFTHEDREAIITFVLGLVADPPTAKHVYRPQGAPEAIVAGRKVLDKYNCAACHMLQVDRWKIAYEPGHFQEERQAGDPPGDAALHPFLKSHLTAEEQGALIRPDARRGQVHATIHGMQLLDDGGYPAYYDSEGLIPREDLESVPPAERMVKLELYQPAVIGASVKESFDELDAGTGEKKSAVRELYEPKIYYPGVENLTLTTDIVKQHVPSEGGFLAKYLAPVAFELEKKANPGAVAGQVWAWLPPPLVGEGAKVQTGWLHDFLLDPHPIRPAVFLRMPRFNMSSAEATALARYFAAVDSAEYPYEFNDRVRPQQLAQADAAYRQHVASLPADQVGKVPAGTPHGTRFDDSMRVVVSQTYCVKCHIVGDFNPQSSDRAKAPDLAAVRNRLRHDYVRRWIANPKLLLPYTAMPIQFQYDPNDKVNNGGLLEKGLYHGTSMEQVDGVTDLLMGFDQYSIGRGRVNALVEAAKPPEAPAENSAGATDGNAGTNAPPAGEGSKPEQKPEPKPEP